MRVHSGCSYADTQMHSCPLCCICYNKSEDMDKHKMEVHPDYDEQIAKLRKCLYIGARMN